MKAVMQGALAAAVLLVALVSPSFAEKAGIGWKETIAAKSGKAKTMAELAKMYDSSSCIECHKDKHDEAEKSVHSRSLFGTGRTAMTLMSSIENGLMEQPYSGVKSPKDVKVEHLMGCAKCHLPATGRCGGLGRPGTGLHPLRLERGQGEERQGGGAERRGETQEPQHQLPRLPQPQCHHPQVAGRLPEGGGRLRLQGGGSSFGEVSQDGGQSHHERGDPVRAVPRTGAAPGSRSADPVLHLLRQLSVGLQVRDGAGFMPGLPHEKEQAWPQYPELP